MDSSAAAEGIGASWKDTPSELTGLHDIGTLGPRGGSEVNKCECALFRTHQQDKQSVLNKFYNQKENVQVILLHIFRMALQKKIDNSKLMKRLCCFQHTNIGHNH